MTAQRDSLACDHESWSAMLSGPLSTTTARSWFGSASVSILSYIRRQVFAVHVSAWHRMIKVIRGPYGSETHAAH